MNSGAPKGAPLQHSFGGVMVDNTNKFLLELSQLMSKYNVTAEEYNDHNLPECGFVANYRSFRFFGPTVNCTFSKIQQYNLKLP